MKSVALTGNVAAGKSRVAELFRGWGATVIDADRLVREIQSPGTAEYEAIIERFGSRILALDGSIDRAALRAIVFADRGARLDLERIIHPAVARRRAELEAAARSQGADLVVSDIPLLFETGDQDNFDRVILVDAPEAVRHARLVRERGLSQDEASRIITAQMPAGRKRAWRDAAGRGPLVIENDEDLSTLERRARAVWETLLGT